MSDNEETINMLLRKQKLTPIWDPKQGYDSLEILARLDLIQSRLGRVSNHYQSNEFRMFLLNFQLTKSFRLEKI